MPKLPIMFITTRECYEIKWFSRVNVLDVYKLLIYVSTCIKKTVSQWCLSSNFRNFPAISRLPCIMGEILQPFVSLLKHLFCVLGVVVQTI
jgi:hypothetical protein